MIKDEKKRYDEKSFNRELAMIKIGSEDFENSTKWWICDNDYVDNDVKVRDHCHITGKYRGSVHRDFNTNLKLNNKIRVAFHNLTIIPILLWKN